MSNFLNTASQWFKTGDTPTQSQFEQFFSYIRWKDESLGIVDIAGLADILGRKQDVGDIPNISWANISDKPMNLATTNWVADNFYTRGQADSRFYGAGNPAGYITSAALSGYATTAWADGRFHPMENQRLSSFSDVGFNSIVSINNTIIGGEVKWRHHITSSGIYSMIPNFGTGLDFGNEFALVPNDQIYWRNNVVFHTGNLRSNAQNDTRFHPLENQPLSTGSNVVFRDVHADRGNGTGVIFFGGNQRYLFWDGFNYVVNTSAGERVLFHQGNRRDNAEDDARYVLKTGDAMIGTLRVATMTEMYNTANNWAYNRYTSGSNFWDIGYNSSSNYLEFRFAGQDARMGIRHNGEVYSKGDAAAFAFFDRQGGMAETRSYVWYGQSNHAFFFTPIAGNTVSVNYNSGVWNFLTNAAIQGSQVLHTGIRRTDAQDDARFHPIENQRLNNFNTVSFVRVNAGTNSTFHGNVTFQVTGNTGARVEVSSMSGHAFVKDGILFETINRNNNTIHNSLSLYSGGDFDLYSRGFSTPAISLQGGVGHFGAFTRFITNYAATLADTSYEFAPIQLRQTLADFNAGARIGLGFHQQGLYGGYLYMNGANEWRYRNHAGSDNQFWHSGNFNPGLYQLNLVGQQSVELGQGFGGDRSTWFDFHAHGASGANDYSARIVRWAGSNGHYDFLNTGFGQMRFVNNNSIIATSNTSVELHSNGTYVQVQGNINRSVIQASYAFVGDFEGIFNGFGIQVNNDISGGNKPIVGVGDMFLIGALSTTFPNVAMGHSWRFGFDDAITCQGYNGSLPSELGTDASNAQLATAFNQLLQAVAGSPKVRADRKLTVEVNGQVFNLALIEDFWC
jgi:hypothetical protein